MQAPGGPEEDTSGGFAHGGWTVPYFEEFLGGVIGEQMGRPLDPLLGRKTFEIFAGYWPQHDDEVGKPINDATKYVASNSVAGHAWKKSIFLNGDIVDKLRTLKQQDGPDLQVHGSSDLIKTLLKHDLVDELWLKIFPVTLGAGKCLFSDGARLAAFTLTDSKTSPSGAIVASLKRAGDVQTGSF